MSELINPYIAGAPVTETRMFFGRDDVFDWIQNSLSGRYADHILVIHGQRRVGKTSVLKQLGNRLPDKYIPVFFDLQGRTHTTLDRFLWWLAREIVRVLKQERDITVPVPEKEAFAADLEYFESRFLPGLKPHIGERSLLLTFDEFDNLEESEVKEELARPLIDYLRRMMGEEGISFIFSIGSSGRKLENMQASYTEFFKTALYKKISFLSKEQTAGLITGPVEGLLEYERQAVECIFEITSGHPYFTQLTCHELFSLCQRSGELHIRETDVEAILEDVVERGTVNLKFTWDEASDLEKWGLATLAHHDEPLNNRALGDFLRAQRVRFSDSDLTSSLLHLREKDILTEENRFVIYLLKLWLRKNRTIEQVREELTEVNPIANRFIEIGLEFQDSGLYDKAIENFREALAVSPDNIQAQVNIAQAYMAQKDLNQAVDEFEKALEMDDEDVASRAGLCEAYLALGDAANEKGKSREAVQAYQKVLAINTEHTEARQRMAEINRARAEKALAVGKDEEALAAFKEALEFTPEDEALSARYEQAKVEKRTKVLASLLAKADKEQAARNWEAALKVLKNALEIAPGEEKVQRRIATVKAEERKESLQAIQARADRAASAGRWGLVIAALEEYLTLEPGDAQIQARIEGARQKLTEAQVEEARTRARGLARQERFEEAITAWNEYLKINPSDDQTVPVEIEKVHKAQALAQNYAEAQKAFSRKNYEKAVSLLRGIVVENADYKEATRLMAEAVELRRTTRKWWQSKWLWGVVVSSVVLAVGWFVFRPGSPLWASPTSPPQEVTATVPEPPALSIPTNTPEPTSTPGPTPTPLPFAWSRLNSGQFLPRDQVTAIVIDPSDPGVLYVGTANAGFYKSIDGGLSWQPVSIENVSSDVSAELLINNDHNSEEGYTVTNVGPDGKARQYRREVNWNVSEDNGNAWNEFGMVGRPGSSAIAFDKEGSIYVYCGTHLCKYSADGKQQNTLGIPDVGPFTLIAFSPHDPNTIYVAGTGLALSNDGGQTWTKLNNGLGSGRLQLDASAGETPSLYLQSGECDEAVRIEKSIQDITQPLYLSTDSGRTWELSAQLGCHLIKDINGTTIYRIGGLFPGVQGGWIWRSPDGGKSWEKALTSHEAITLTTDPLLSGSLYLYVSKWETWANQQYVSVDYGNNWNIKEPPADIKTCTGATPQFIDKYRPTAIDPNDGNHVLFIDEGSLQESHNSCESWDQMAKQPPYPLNGVAIDPKDPSRIYIGADSGAYVSFDSGQSWGQVNDGLLGATVVYSIVVDPESNVYAATPYGIFKLENK